MPNILSHFIGRAIMMALAFLFVAVIAGPATAFPLSQHVSPGQLKSHCDAVGGEYGGALGHYWCQSPNGNEVDCDIKKCYGHIAELTGPGTPKGAGVSASTLGVLVGASGGVPCDPLFCAIYCRREPTCKFGGETVPVIRPESATDTGSTGSLSSFSGGAAPTKSPAGVPISP